MTENGRGLEDVEEVEDGMMGKECLVGVVGGDGRGLEREVEEASTWMTPVVM